VALSLAPALRSDQLDPRLKLWPAVTLCAADFAQRLAVF
jgi:hypothetical protein